MTEKRFTRKSYSIWDNVENEEFYELHYRYEVDDMCYVLNDYEEKVKSLEKKNEQLKKQLIEKERMLDVRDKIIADVMKAVNGNVE